MRRSALSSGLILNSFEDLEGPVLDQIRKPIVNLYSIGPLHTHLKSRLESEKSEVSSLPLSSFYEEDRSSITWLDSQPAKSVLYVSFGSVTLLTRNELLEFWYGLVDSGHRFLWVMRPDSIAGDGKENPIPAELDEATKERGYLVGWVRDIMEERRDEFLERAHVMADLAKKAISEEETSYKNLNRLIEFIKSSV